MNPDLRAVRDVPRIYWRLDGDAVVAMDAAEQAAKDVEIAAAEKASRETAARGQYDADALTRALALVLLDEQAVLREALNYATKAQTKTISAMLKQVERRVAEVEDDEAATIVLIL